MSENNVDDVKQAPTPSSRSNRSRLALRPSMASQVKLETIGTDTQALLLGTERLDYDQFCQVVTTSPKLLALLFANRVISTHDMDSLATSLMKVAKELGSSTILFENLLRLEFDKASKSKTTTILRGNTLTTKCLDQFIQNYGTKYLRNVLQPPLSKLLSNEAVDLEVDPQKIKFTEDENLKQQAVNDHVENLKEYTNIFLQALTSKQTIDNFPFEARFVARMIAALAENYSWDVVPLVGSFVILRFFNPSIVFPETREILPANIKIPPIHRRNLVLISKVIQNLANSMEFGVKEEYMAPMNDYIKENQEKVNSFLQSVRLSNEEYEQHRTPIQDQILAAVRQRKIISNSQDLMNEAMNIQLLIEKNADKIKESLDESSSMDGNELDNLLKRLPSISADITPPTEEPIIVPSTETSANLVDDKAYQKLLEKAKTGEYQDLEAMQILTVRGKDNDGRPIVVLTEERIRKEDLERVILFIILKLDKVVEQDYVMIWCVNNSANQQRPGFSWLLNVYRSLARKYKKNLKKFYLVHPTFMFKLIIKCFRPFVSEKFWKKLVMADRVQEIYKDIDKSKVPLPPSVLAYDFLLRGANEPTIQPPVFAEPLDKVMKRPDHVGHSIPIILEECFAYILQGDLVQTQGIFRISGAVSEVQKLKILYNNGDHIDLAHCDVHTVSSLVKLFFREMPEPLFLYELYDSFIGIFEQSGTPSVDENQHTISNHAYIEPIQRLLRRLPKINYAITETMFRVLNLAQKYSDINLMNSRNLAIVFGPNILRNRNDTPLAALKDNGLITRVIEMIIVEYDNIFEK
jgi:Rho GTPase-activating protein 1